LWLQASPSRHGILGQQPFEALLKHVEMTWCGQRMVVLLSFFCADTILLSPFLFRDA